MTGNQNIYASILLIGAILNIVLNLILIPLYGINGAALASMSSLIVWNFVELDMLSLSFKIILVLVPMF